MVVVVRVQYVAIDQLLKAGGIDFDFSIDEDQRRLPGGADPAPLRTCTKFTRKLRLRNYKINRVYFLNETMKPKRQEKSCRMLRLLAGARMSKVLFPPPGRRR